MHSIWNRSLRAALAASAVALAPAAALAGPTGNVQSNNLRDADGTTGQDSTRGAGVKTPHLQNGAVTAPKLAPAAVGTAALADGSVTAGKLAPAAIGTAALQDGAVTPAKLAGPIPAAQLDRTGLDADTVDGLHGDQVRRKLRNVIVVSLDGQGDFASPLDAMASITDASAATPYVVRLAPGVYDLGATPLVVKPYVSVVGAGESATFLSGTCADLPPPALGMGYAAVVGIGDYATLANLTVRVVGGPMVGTPTAISTTEFEVVGATVERVSIVVEPGVYAAGLALFGGVQDFLVRHVTVAATSYGLYMMGTTTGGSIEVTDSFLSCSDPYGYGAYAGIGAGSLRIHNTRIAGGKGWRNFFGFVEATNVTVVGTFGNQRYSAAYPQRVTLEHSAILGSVQDDGGDLSIADTRVEGTITTASFFGATPVLRCHGVYDRNFTPVTCP